MRAPVTNLLSNAVRDFASVPPFDRYVDPDHVLVVATRGRRGPSGKRAACHFTRFRDTGERLSRDGRWRLPEVKVNGREIRYLISFVLPRFLFLSQKDQAEDIVHELLHIDPSFTGVASRLRHGRAFDARVQAIADRARRRGLTVPGLAADGETAYYHRLRPLPHPYRTTDPAARWLIDESALELAALRVDVQDRAAPPPRYVYRCPVCGETYPRRKRLVMASCGSCANSYDGRFKLKLVWSERRNGGAGPP